MLCSCAAAPTPTGSESPQAERVFADPAGGEVRYLVYLPAAHRAGPGPPPLVLFLHGDGERGDDLRLVKREGLPRILERNRDFPFVVVAPQLRRSEKWSEDRLDRLLEHAIEAYRVDPRRVYVTGLSSGAVASLALAVHRPERVAAAAAVSPNKPPDVEPCASPPSGQAKKTAAIWLFHNAYDERVPARVSRRLARALEACGSEVRLTIFPRAGHDAWSDAYAQGDLYRWLLDHRTDR